MHDQPASLESGELLRIDEVARLLKLSTRHIKRLVRQKSFPHPVTIGSRCKRWKADDVRAHIEELSRRSIESATSLLESPAINVSNPLGSGKAAAMPRSRRR